MGCIAVQGFSYLLTFLLKKFAPLVYGDFGFFASGQESKNLISEYINSHGIIEIILLLVFAAFVGPVFEEGAFRAPLRFNLQSLSIAFVSLLFIFLPRLLSLCDIRVTLVHKFVTLSILMIIFVVRFWRTGFSYDVDGGRVAPIWMVFVSVFLFGYSHSFNYEDSKGGWMFVNPVFFIDKFVDGVFFSWVRIRYGFLWGLMVHVFKNTIGVVFVSLLYSLFSILFGF
ncbi:CPBP family glutamic-type intramembrane protease [Nostoc sp. NIES-2111]